MVAIRTRSGRTQGERSESLQTRARDMMMRAELGSSFIGTSARMRRITDVALWGYVGRDANLRQLWRLQGAEPIQAAITAIIQKVGSTGWYIEGPRRVAGRVHGMLHNADFGGGWESFLSKIIIDYLTQDNGCFVEILGEGPKNTMLEGAVLGIAQLDSGRCLRSGDPNYPVIYTDQNGRRHWLHWSRVWFQSDLPAPEEVKLGRGFCALSRCIATAQASIAWSEMRSELIDDFPAAGMILFKGINKGQFEDQMKAYEADRAAKEQRFYRGIINLFQPNAQLGLEANPVNFRSVWEGFSERELYDIIIDLVAMAFGIDRQEIAPLATSALGSGAQSTVLNQKSRGKGVGNLLSVIERFINRILPQSVSFRFDYADDEQDMRQAEIRQMKATTITSLYTANGKPSNRAIDTVQTIEPSYTTEVAQGGLLTREEARYMLAKEGIIPRELLTDDERSDWEQFDDITMKSWNVYGLPVRIKKDGKMLNELTWGSWKRQSLHSIA